MNLFSLSTQEQIVLFTPGEAAAGPYVRSLRTNTSMYTPIAKEVRGAVVMIERTATDHTLCIWQLKCRTRSILWGVVSF